MTAVFADTAYWIALVNPHDQLHGLAKKQSSVLGAPIVTSELVLVELLNYFADCGPILRSRTSSAVASILSSEDVLVVRQASRDFEHAFQLYKSRTDKRWSLTDCHSFQLMHHYSLDTALTADRHFEQAGFKALLREA